MDAVLTAAIQSQQNGLNVLPEIMIPLVATSGELEVILQGLEQTAQQTFHRLGERIAYKIGTMMEVPRACVQSRTVAPQVQFMSFGTNDLTQTTFGLSREDMGKFLPNYLEHKILPFNPFISLDQQGVGNLIRMALEQSRKVQKKNENTAFAENMLGTHDRSCSSTASAWTMSPAALIASLPPALPPPRRVFETSLNNLHLSNKGINLGRSIPKIHFFYPF